MSAATVETTPAVRQAELLAALAAHLRSHPGLVPAGVNGSGFVYGIGAPDLHLCTSHRGGGLGELLAWAGSLGAVGVRLQRFPDQDYQPRYHAHLVDSELAGDPVHAWAAVTDLDPLDVADGTVIAVDELPGLVADATAQAARAAVLAQAGAR